MTLRQFLIGLALLLTALGTSFAGEGPSECCTPVPCDQNGDFNSYETKVPTEGTVQACTPFACGTISVQRLRRVFVPFGPITTDLHYTAYEIKSSTYPVSFNPASATFDTAYGIATQDMRKRLVYLVLPAGKTIPPSPPPTIPAAPAEGFLCFSASDEQFSRANITTTDQFGTQTYFIHRLSWTCVSAAINSGGNPPTDVQWLLGIAAKGSDLIHLPVVNLIDLLHPVGTAVQIDPIDELVGRATVKIALPQRGRPR